MFYSKKCGAIKSVKIEKRQKKTTYDKAKYALVEFAHKDSVEVVIYSQYTQYHIATVNAQSTDIIHIAYFRGLIFVVCSEHVIIVAYYPWLLLESTDFCGVDFLFWGSQ